MTIINKLKVGLLTRIVAKGDSGGRILCLKMRSNKKVKKIFIL